MFFFVRFFCAVLKIKKMSWSRDQVNILIEEYKKHPCLFAVKSKDYKNKHARNKALELVHGAFREVKPAVTIAEIKTKFHGLKTNFMAEHRKHVDSLKSGAGEEDVSSLFVLSTYYSRFYTNIVFFRSTIPHCGILNKWTLFWNIIFQGKQLMSCHQGRHPNIGLKPLLLVN